MFSSTLDNRRNSASSSRSSTRGYVNPTFQSSVFSHLNDNLSASCVAPNTTSELGLPARKKVERIERYSYVMPSAHEYVPKAGDVNNPDAYKDTEKHASAIANKRLQQEYDALKEQKEKLNSHVRGEQEKLEQKHQTRLDHKKPSQEARQEYKAAESQYITETLHGMNKAKNERSNYAGDLTSQMQKNSNKLQAELEREKNDTRTGFAMKERKEYNMQEYKDVLKKQVNEKTLRASQEKNVKNNEREARLQELRDQERMVEHYSQQVANRRPQSALQTGKTTSVVNSGTLGKKNDWEAASLELLQKKDEQDIHRKTLQEQIESKTNKREQEISKKKTEERNIKGFDLANHRPWVTANQVADVLKTQMKEKQQVKDKEAQVKQSEVVARKEDLKGSERVAWQEYEQYRQKKAEMFDQYKKDHSSYAPIKKNKGLMTVKIN